MIWRSGPDKLCDWFNKPWLDFTGRPMESELGNGWADRVHPADFDRCIAIYTTAFDAREKFSMTYRLLRHDGAWRWLLDNGAPYNRNGQFAGYFGTCVDVTDQREEHERLLETIEEREALLREVYHRVKNNLQQIEGLIAIEQVTLADPAATEALGALSGRVRAMGAVHSTLMRSKRLSKVDARDFLSELCGDIARSVGADSRGIALSVIAERRDVDIEQAVIIGLLVNELVTNAFKHAFPGRAGGRIEVRYGPAPAGGSVLEVADDGVGFPAGGHSLKEGHSGYRLINGFVDQLNGQLSVEQAGGAVLRVTLP